MDIEKTLRELYEEKKRLDAAIAALEQHAEPASRPAVRERRGRRSMSPEERQEVSRRMRKFWEARRAQRKTGENQAGSGMASGSA